MGDATRHLTQSAQTLLLHDRLLRLAKILVGALQGPIKLALVGCECDVAAQLPQELTVPAQEAALRAACRDHYPEDFAFHNERRKHEGMQSDAAQPRVERKL